MPKLYEEQEVHAALQKFVAEHGTQVSAAKALGISVQYLGDLLSQRRDMTDTVAQQLGYTKKVLFEKG